MLFTIKKNISNTMDIFPNFGVFHGQHIATAEALDMTSVIARGDAAVGIIKAVWGLQFNPEVDVFSDTETVRALRLGKAFKGDANFPLTWAPEGIYDINSGRIIRGCKRLVITGTSLYRGFNAIF